MQNELFIDDLAWLLCRYKLVRMNYISLNLFGELSKVK